MGGLWEGSVGTLKNSQKPVYTSRIHVHLPMESYCKIHGGWRFQQPNIAKERMKLKTGSFRVMGGSEQSLCHLGGGQDSYMYGYFLKQCKI